MESTMVPHAVDPRLAGAVRRMVGFAEYSPTPLRRREVPQDEVTLILNLGAPLGVSGPTFPATWCGSFVAPLNDAHAVTEFLGESRGIQVDLAPLAAHMLFGVPMRELSELVVDLEHVLGDALLIERLHEAPTWNARFLLLESLIGRRLEDARRPAPDAAWAWHRLKETDGRLPIGALAGEIGCSRRHLVARFREHLGPPPKTAARILRFRRVLRQMDRDDGSRMGDIALDCGYYDQAHLNRDFRELAGTTPGDYVASRMTDAPGIAA